MIREDIIGLGMGYLGVIIMTFLTVKGWLDPIYNTMKPINLVILGGMFFTYYYGRIKGKYEDSLESSEEDLNNKGSMY